MSSDILDRLAVYAPTPTSVAGEWGPDEREQGLAAVLDDGSGEGRSDRSQRLRFVPAPGSRRTRAIAPIAASVAVLVLAGGVAVLASRGHGSGDPAAGQSSDNRKAGVHTAFRASVATPTVGPREWAFRAVSSYDINRNTESTVQKSAVWVARDGSGPRYDFDGATATCGHTAAVRRPGFDEPTQAFVAALPTDPGALKAYLVRHVQGSTSQEEAIFTAVGDLLRTGDLLATSAQRAAMVTVLDQLTRTTTWHDIDARGRPAFRVDFADPNQRGGEIQSLYFDTRTFQLLEERSSTGPAPAGPQPSALYTSTPSNGATATERLPAKASITVMTEDKVVNTADRFCGLPVAPSLLH